MQDMERQQFIDECAQKAVAAADSGKLDPYKIFVFAAELVTEKYKGVKTGELLDAFVRLEKAEAEKKERLASATRIFGKFGDPTKPDEPFRDVCARAAAAGDPEALAWCEPA